MLLTLADVLALDPVRRGAPKVVAGSDRLDTPVRWVHVIELAEAGHLLRGGELVLSTGIALPPDPDGLARYVAGLAAAGVSGLAVELGSRYVRELPRALVTAATGHRLPLIVFERETQFIAITEAVHAQILDAQVAELRAAQRLNQVFADLAIAGAGQEAIVAQASALAGTPVILADLAHRVLACAPAFHDVASLLAGFATRSRAVATGDRTRYDPGAGWLITTVGARGTDWGRLIFVMAQPPDAGATVLAERAASTLALARLAVGRAEEPPERTAHRGLIAALTGAGYASARELETRIVALGVPLAGHRLLPVLVHLAVAGRESEVASAVAMACQQLRTPVICGQLDDRRVAALLAIEPNADEADLLARLASLLRAEVIGPADAIGTAPPVAEIGQARAALREADDAAGAVAAGGELAGKPFATLADLGLAGLLYQLRDDPRVLSFAEREAGRLLLHDQQAGTSLTAVLGWYLESGASKAAAAHRAGLARPTLYQRLGQIEQVLGVRLASTRTRLALHAALLVLGWRADLPIVTDPKEQG